MAQLSSNDILKIKMIANHIHQALAQVQELRRKVLDKQRFKGYSGRMRALGGCVALIASVVMSADFYPKSPFPHFQGWAVVFMIAVALNYGALLYWFLFDPSVERDIRKLRPVFDIMPPIIVGGIMTVAFFYHKDYDYLFGMWMCLFGLANIASRHVLPRQICLLGLYYIIAGMFLLTTSSVSFTNPWPMGIVFFFGEWAGGFILHYDEPRSFFSLKILHQEGETKDEI
jgi:hypothetical protein